MKKFTYRDYTIMQGETPRENWKLLSESHSLNYILHLSSFPSCYVVIDCRGTPSIDVIKYAALICKGGTKYRNLRNVKVDYCLCSNVKKGSVVGEMVYKSNRKVKTIIPN